MSKTTDKMNKLATQHKIIGVKTDCPHFSNIGNLCSRVENGMMRCDEYLECEFKYIDALKEENEKLTETCESLLKIQYALADSCKKYSNCLEEIKAYCKSCEYGLQPQKIVNYIDEILESENQ